MGFVCEASCKKTLDSSEQPSDSRLPNWLRVSCHPGLKLGNPASLASLSSQHCKWGLFAPGSGPNGHEEMLRILPKIY
jgi:hypothetical protein